MDPDQQLPSAPRKPRFTPKAPPRRKPKPPKPNREAADDDDGTGTDEAAQALLRRVSEHLGKHGPKAEKSTVQVTFAQGVASSRPIRSFGVPREANNSIKTDSSYMKSSADEGKSLFLSPSTVNESDGTTSSSVTVVGSSSQKKKEEYREPWDYNSYYPVTLPWRPPYSGNPELLNEVEFGGAAMDLEYDDSTVNSASELGLQEKNDKPRMMFLQIPANLPLKKRPTTAKGKEKMGDGSNKGLGLGELPKGHMGKLLVYKSGAVKWKIGEVLFDVSPGVNCAFSQDIVAINTSEKHVCALGEVGKRAVVTPDMDSLLNKGLDLGTAEIET